MDGVTVGSGRVRGLLIVVVPLFVMGTAIAGLSALGAAPWLVAAASSAGAIMTILGERALLRVLDGKGDEARPPRRRVVFGEIPLACPAFHPRDVLPRKLVRSPRKLVLVGISGVGKSQIAADYARRCIDAGWPVVAWFDAGTPNRLLAGWEGLAVDLGVPAEDADPVRAVRAHLEQLGQPSLLVFDNARDIEPIAGLLPRYGRIVTLITSTSRRFDNLGKAITVSVFTELEAATFLAERTGLRDDAGAIDLAKELDRLPLALSQAASLIRTQRLSYSTYRERLREFNVDEYLTPVAGDPYPRGVAQAIGLSLADAEANDPSDGLAQPLLWLLCMLSPAGVSRRIIHLCATGLIEELDQQHAHAAADAALGALADACLISIGEDGETIVMHRLVARITRERAVRQGHAEKLAIVACQTLESALPGERVPERAEGDHLADQIEAVFDSAKGLGLADRDWERIFELRYWAAGYRVTLAEPPREVALLSQLIADREAVLGPGEGRLRNLRTRLAQAQLSAGQIDEAIDLLTSLLPEPGDTRFTMARTNLAHAYQLAGRHSKAVEQLIITVDERRKNLGPTDPMVSRVEADLAQACLAAGNTGQALRFALAAVGNCEERLPRGHWITMQARISLAACHLATGDFPAAIALYDVMLADLSPMEVDDPAGAAAVRAQILEYQAVAHERAGQWGEAVSRREAAVTATAGLPACLREWLAARSNLARTHLERGRPHDAVHLLRPLLTEMERCYGSDHAAVSACRDRLRSAERKARRAFWSRPLRLFSVR